MQELKEKLEHALQNFNYADPEYVDAAIYELNAAEEYMNEVYKAAVRHFGNRNRLKGEILTSRYKAYKRLKSLD